MNYLSNTSGDFFGIRFKFYCIYCENYNRWCACEYEKVDIDKGKCPYFKEVINEDDTQSREDNC